VKEAKALLALKPSIRRIALRIGQGAQGGTRLSEAKDQVVLALEAARGLSPHSNYFFN